METIPESGIAGILGPMVILGDPGLGKSVLAEKIGREGNNLYVRAGTFVRSKAPSSYLPQGDGRLIIDGLDEIGSTTLGGGVDAVLAQLSAIGNPPFTLSSREADWRGASARVRIEDDYGQEVTVLHLEPFNRDDADAFLRAFFSDVDATAVLDHLAARGLADIYRNPLTLRMIGEVAHAETTLPATRVDLLGRACTIMLQEENPRHQDAPHALRSEEELLLAAGAICATVLICDRSGAYTGPTSKTPDGFLHLSAVQSLTLADVAAEALQTRLFRAEGESRFLASHRVIAEYLGAQWVAACFDGGASERRIRSLITLGGAVPTSLRGLNAWLAHFSSALAPDCIAADPYAVLRYGNAETLPLEQARILLGELAKLSSADPYFRAEDWSRHPAAGLMRNELKDEIVAILSDERTHPHLSFLLLEAMAGSSVAGSLICDLEAILFDPDRPYQMRSRAVDVLASCGTSEPTKSRIERLLALGDGDSQRIAFEILIEAGLAAVPMNLAVETLLAHVGLTVSRLNSKREHSADMPRKIITTLSGPQLQAFLDDLAAYAGPLMGGEANHSAKDEIADVALAAVVTALQSGTPVSPDRVWRWLRWVGYYEGYDRETTKAMHNVFRENATLRRGIQAAALLNTATTNVRSAAANLTEISSSLFPNEDDVLALIQLLGKQTDGPPNLQQVRELASLARARDGLPASVRGAAVILAKGDPDLIHDLDEWSKPIVYEWEERRKRQTAEAAAKREQEYRQVREQYAARISDIRAGDHRWLERPAKVYLGRFPEFSRNEKPEARVEVFLGPELAQHTLDGFMATLYRDDLPSPAEVVQSHIKNRHWPVETVLVCGVAEMIRREMPLDAAPRPALNSAYMAWRRQNESTVVGGVEIGPALEAVVLTNDSQAETFFRASIEPQLDAGFSHIRDLYPLIHGGRWQALAGRLAIEWLIRHDRLPTATEAELLDAAVWYGDSDHLKNLLAIGRFRVHTSFETMLDWLAIDFVLDFEQCQQHVADAARDEPNFLWRIQSRIASDRHEAFVPLTIAQRAFLVRVFGSTWPQTERPDTGWTGDTNPWDASAFITRLIYSIAGDKTPEATESLRSLLSSGSAPSYTDTLRHALALQRKLRRDSEYVPASLDQVQSVASSALPETIDDMRAYFGDRVATVQSRMHTTNTDMWEAYWDGSKPRRENFCRNRLVEHISAQLPGAVRFEPEMHMPNQKRADIAAIRDVIGLPVEIKGQWHPAVWEAPVRQLAAQYARDWHAEGRGVYIVIWFRDVPGKQLPPHPDGLMTPTTPEMLRAMLIDRIPEVMRDLIDVYVVDVIRMR